MEQWLKEERRQSARYDVTLQAKGVVGFMSDALFITSHDISTQGAGFIVGQKFETGEKIGISFIMPDNAEQISVNGNIVWVDSIGSQRYRIGVKFCDHDIRPIPMVLRSIKARTSRYNC